MLIYKNVWRRPAQTWLLLLAISLIVSLIALLQAQVAGLEQDIYEHTIQAWVGKWQIKSKKDFLFDDVTRKAFDEKFSQLAYQPVLRTQGWLKYQKTAIPVQILGIDTLQGKAVQGLMLSTHLQKLCGVQVLDSLVLTALPTLQAKETAFCVREARKWTVANGENLIVLPLKIAQKFANATQKITFLKISEHISTKALENFAPDWRIETWKKSMPELAQMLSLLEATFVLVGGILMFLLGLGLYAVITQSWQERQSEFERLRILGMTRRQVWRLLVGELYLILGLGYALGMLVSLSLLAYLTQQPLSLPTNMTQGLQDMGFPTHISFLINFQVFAYPCLGLGLCSVVLMLWAWLFSASAKF